MCTLVLVHVRAHLGQGGGHIKTKKGKEMCTTDFHLLSFKCCMTISKGEQTR